MFLLYYEASTKKVSAMNGSGRAGSRCTLDRIRAELGVEEGKAGKIPMSSVHAVTVPGAAAGWVDAVERFGSGKVGLAEVLGPAIELGEKGFPAGELTAAYVSFYSPCFRMARLWLTRGTKVASCGEKHPGCLPQLLRDAEV
jgi:gamma-glutamyltranspeptidase / glutathione hydrolase